MTEDAGLAEARRGRKEWRTSSCRSWYRLYSTSVSSEILTSFIIPSAALVNAAPASILNLASMLRSASSETDRLEMRRLAR